MTTVHDGRRVSRTGRRTRERIIEATLETVRVEGLFGTSARAIARTGQFNQALVFYHFGSVEELLLESLRWANRHRMEHFKVRFDQVRTLVELVDVAEDLFLSPDYDYQVSVASIMAGWPADSELGQQVNEILRPWDDLVEASLRRCLENSAFVDIVRRDDLRFGLVSLLLGVELTRRFHRNDKRIISLFASLRAVAAAVS